MGAESSVASAVRKGRRTAREEKPSERGVRGGREDLSKPPAGENGSAVRAREASGFERASEEFEEPPVYSLGSPPPERLIGRRPLESGAGSAALRREENRQPPREEVPLKAPPAQNDRKGSRAFKGTSYLPLSVFLR